jgi:phosphoesterase, MJ0936 family
MKILVVSDSHGNSELLYRTADKEHPDMFIHLGDLEDSRQNVEKRIGAPNVPCIFIKGNCDYFSGDDLKDRSVFKLKGHKFLCVHGHVQSVGYRKDSLLYTAAEEGCDIVLYGHTHVPFDEFIEVPFENRKVHVMNPGSIALPRGGSSRSYLVIDMSDSGAYESEFKSL